MPVGTPIDGVVAGDVKDKHTVVIPAGSPVGGRICRMKRYTAPFVYFVVGIEFTEVEVEGIRHLFYAALVHIDPAPGVELTLSTGNHGVDTPRDQLGGPGTVTTVIRERVVVHNLPGVATFFFKGDQLSLPANFRHGLENSGLEAIGACRGAGIPAGSVWLPHPCYGRSPLSGYAQSTAYRDGFNLVILHNALKGMALAVSE